MGEPYYRPSFGLHSQNCVVVRDVWKFHESNPFGQVRIPRKGVAMSDEELEGIEDDRIKTLIRETREGQKKLADERKALEAERKQVAFDRLGIPETGPGLMFRENYQGEPTLEAVKQAADRYGLLEPVQPMNQPVPQTSQSANELEFMRSMQGSVGTTGANPRVEDEIYAQLNAAGSTEEILAIVQKYDLKLNTSDLATAPQAWQ